MNNQIANLRDSHGLTQEALAREVGTSRQTIISIEKGRYDPGLKLALRIAQAFDTPVEEIFTLDD